MGDGFLRVWFQMLIRKVIRESGKDLIGVFDFNLTLSGCSLIDLYLHDLLGLFQMLICFLRLFHFSSQNAIAGKWLFVGLIQMLCM